MWQDIKNIYHLLNAVVANTWLRFPSRKFKVIGVTGTDGKTTTVSLIYHILKESGYNVSMITSIGAKIAGSDFDTGFHVTTPSVWQLQRFISKAKENALEDATNYLVLEITSHALDQGREWGIEFEVGALTNVTNEHLDYHRTYEKYVKTKFELLKNAKIGVVNKDDKSYEIISRFKNFKQKNKKWITYAVKSNADFTPKTFPFKSSLLERFNLYNTLAAISVCKSLGIEDEKIRRAIKTFTLPIGRAEEVYRKDFSIIIDFAHTPNAIENILSSLRKKTKGRIIHVFGSAGERDVSKRSKMGEASSRFADVIVLTAEDPRSENVDRINDEIQKGIGRKFKLATVQEYKDKQSNKNIYFKINDRLEAVKFAVAIAKRGDLVVLTGKGHEKSMNLGKGEVLWSEYEAVKTAIQERLPKES